MKWTFSAYRDGQSAHGDVTAPDEDEARRLAFHEIAKAFNMGEELDKAACGEDWDYFAAELDGFALDESPPADPLIAAAPAMLAALQAILDGGSWQDDGSFVYWPPDDEPGEYPDTSGGAIDDAAAAIAAATGGATGEPASPTVEGGPTVQTFTAFCQSSAGTGTIWIDTVQAPDLQSAIGEARQQCAIEWGCEIPFVHCLGIAAGDVEILQWSDIDD